MKQTAMQELIEDLQETISVATEALSKIENEAIKTACQEAFRLTLKKIIKRIDEELLEKEKQQIIDACQGEHLTPSFIDRAIISDNSLGEQYYKETFKL